MCYSITEFFVSRTKQGPKQNANITIQLMRKEKKKEETVFCERLFLTTRHQETLKRWFGCWEETGMLTCRPPSAHLSTTELAGPPQMLARRTMHWPIRRRTRPRCWAHWSTTAARLLADALAHSTRPSAATLAHAAELAGTTHALVCTSAHVCRCRVRSSVPLRTSVGAACMLARAAAYVHCSSRAASRVCYLRPRSHALPMASSLTPAVACVRKQPPCIVSVGLVGRVW